MVLPEHRGHALGLALKLAPMRRSLPCSRSAGSWSPTTQTATRHMNAVNEAMGYRLVEDLHEVQKELA